MVIRIRIKPLKFHNHGKLFGTFKVYFQPIFLTWSPTLPTQDNVSLTQTNKKCMRRNNVGFECAYSIAQLVRSFVNFKGADQSADEYAMCAVQLRSHSDKQAS